MRHFSWILFIFTLGAMLAKTTDGDDLSEERNALLAVAHKLESALNELRSIEKGKASSAGLPTRLLKVPQDATMTQIISVEEWEGELEPLLAEIAKQCQYQVDCFGKRPPSPVRISINMKGKTVGTVLQNIELQVRPYVNMTINETRRIIELHYAAATI